MPQTFEAILASGSTNGRQILIAATATPGTLLHTATADPAEIDEVTVELSVPTHTAALLATIEVGGVTSPNDLVVLSVNNKAGVTTAVFQRRLNGGVVVRCFAGTTNLVVASVTVNRISNA